MTQIAASEISPDKLDQLINDILEGMQTGNSSLDLDSLTKQYPDLAPELLKIFPALVAMAKWDPSADADFNLTDLDPSHNKPLGDFQIIRQIGRGGMGVVYEARQLSIARNVALKVLPLAALIDSRALQRFHNEVNAIATLDHRNIVSVYSVGEERGIHYFAMQLIRGESLANVIRELKSRSDRPLSGNAFSQVISDLDDKKGSGAVSSVDPPTKTHEKVAAAAAAETRRYATSATSGNRTDQTFFRNAARLIAKTATALHHAHESGVIHRDIKPGNLLLDRSGDIFIADFGLARIESNPGVTITGDVLGTLRYMSPEQVLANRVVIDHRTDIYSLGATLYELLTLQPMWSGKDKAEIIRQISFEEPVGSQKITPSIPTDLDTILQKATRKNPIERYQTAQDFADDLQRFLDDKPIIAKRVTWLQHLTKFAQRHPAAMWATTIACVLLASAFAISNILVARAWQNEAQASRAEQAARQDAESAREQAETAREKEAIARQEAESKSKLARDVVDDFYVGVATEWLDDQGKLTELQRELLEKARKLYEVFALEESDDPDILYETAVANYNVGVLDSRMGRYEQSLTYFSRADNILTKLLDVQPNDSERCKLLLKSLAQRAKSLDILGRFDAAIKTYETSIKTLEPLVKEFPEDPIFDLRMAQSFYGIASMSIMANDWNHAAMELQKATETLSLVTEKAANIPEPQDAQTSISRQIFQTKVGCLNLQAAVLEHQGDFEESIEISRQSIQLQEAVADRYPSDINSRFSLAIERHNFAGSLAMSGQLMESIDLSRMSLSDLEKLKREFPKNEEYSSLIPFVMHNIARHLTDNQQPELAEEFYRRLFKAQQEFSQSFPEAAATDAGPNSWRLFNTRSRLEYGLLLYDANRFDEAEFQFKLSLDADPMTPEAHFMKASIHRKRKQNAKANACYQDVVEHNELHIASLEEGDPEQIAPSFMMAAALARLDQWDDAERWYRDAEKRLSNIPVKFHSRDPNIKRFRSEAKQLLESRAP